MKIKHNKTIKYQLLLSYNSHIDIFYIYSCIREKKAKAKKQKEKKMQGEFGPHRHKNT